MYIEVNKMNNPLEHFGIRTRMIRGDTTSYNMPMAGQKAPLRRELGERFGSKENRDARYNELKGMGENVVKRSSGLTIIDPRYIEDSGHTVDLGLGNEKFHYKKTYSIERPR
jgi:hypothetical protein